MAKLTKDEQGDLISQVNNEISFARDFKQGKIANWKINEKLYYGNKNIIPENARANVDLGLMSSFVHTILSKIDEPLVFKFNKRKESQRQRVEQLNRLREIDAENNFVNEDQWVSTEDEPDHDGLCLREQEYFQKAINEDVDLTDHMNDAINSLRIVLAADESFKTGKTIEFK